MRIPFTIDFRGLYILLNVQIADLSLKSALEMQTL